MKCKNCVRYVHLNDDGERTIGTPNWCFYLSDSTNEELERDCIAFKSLTNADRIRAMTDEELDRFLSGVHNNVGSGRAQITKWKSSDRPIRIWRTGWLDWLKQEVSTDGN